MSYANQYQIIFSGVDEKVRPEKGEGFLLCKKEVITEAFKNLTYSEFRLFMYLLLQRGYEKKDKIFWLSPEAIKQEIGLPVPSYRDARVGLQRKGYLNICGDNQFIFYPFPKQ